MTMFYGYSECYHGESCVFQFIIYENVYKALSNIRVYESLQLLGPTTFLRYTFRDLRASIILVSKNSPFFIWMSILCYSENPSS